MTSVGIQTEVKMALDPRGIWVTTENVSGHKHGCIRSDKEFPIGSAFIVIRVIPEVERVTSTAPMICIGPDGVEFEAWYNLLARSKKADPSQS